MRALVLRIVPKDKILRSVNALIIYLFYTCTRNQLQSVEAVCSP